MKYYEDWGIFVEKNYHDLRKLTKKITNLHSEYFEDMFHDILLFIENRNFLSKYKPELASFDTWISYMVRYSYMSILKRDHKEIGKELLIDDEAIYRGIDNEEESVVTDLKKKILTKLSPVNRRIFIMKCDDAELTHETIAKQFGVTKQRIHQRVRDDIRPVVKKMLNK